MNATIYPVTATDKTLTWSVEPAGIRCGRDRPERLAYHIHKSGSFKVCAVSNSDPSIRAEVSFASLGDVAIPDKTDNLHIWR